MKDFRHILKIHASTADGYNISTGFLIQAHTPPRTLRKNMISHSLIAAIPASDNELRRQYFLGCCRSTRRPARSASHPSVPAS